MSVEYRLPELGEGIDEAEIVRWLVKPGDRIARDQPVAQVQTDKAVVDLPAPAGGVIAALGAAEGERIHVGDLVVAIAEAAGSSPDGAGPAGDGGAVVQGIVGTIPGEEPIRDPGTGAPASGAAPGRPLGSGGRAAPAAVATPVPAAPPATSTLGPAATPATRRLARELGVDLAAVSGTGPGGRVTDADVRAAAAPGAPPSVPARPSPAPSATPSATPTAIPIRGLRRRIAERMEEAARIPRVTMMDEADATALVALRTQLRPAAEEAGVRLAYLPLICRLAMAALRSHPALNAHYDAAAGEIRTFAGVDLGIATATGGRGRPEGHRGPPRRGHPHPSRDRRVRCR